MKDPRSILNKTVLLAVIGVQAVLLVADQRTILKWKTAFQTMEKAATDAQQTAREAQALGTTAYELAMQSNKQRDEALEKLVRARQYIAKTPPPHYILTRTNNINTITVDPRQP